MVRRGGGKAREGLYQSGKTPVEWIQKSRVDSCIYLRDIAKDPGKAAVRASVARHLKEPVARSSIAEFCPVYILKLEANLPAKEIRRFFL